MATNYSKWDKFDVSQEADACEKRWEVDALEEESGRVAMQLQQATSAVHQSTLRSAESLKSKAAVEQLRAKAGGRPGGRSRRNATQSASESVEEEVSPIGQLANTLGGISVELAEILGRMDELKAATKTREGAEASLYGGLSLLGALTRLGAQCVRLRRGEAWSSPEARPCDGLMTDIERSILSLYGEATSVISVLSLNLGEYAVAADMSRCMLKLAQTGQEGDKTCQGPHDHSGQAKGRQNEKPPRHGEAIMFVVRGLAFLCMGNAYLCHVHLSQALDLHPRYPGLSALSARVEEEVQHQAKCARQRSGPLWALVRAVMKREVQRHIDSAAVIITPTRLDMVDVGKILRGGAEGSDGSIETSLVETGGLHMDEMLSPAPAGTAAEESTDRSHEEWVESHLTSVRDILTLIRRSFYEGQMFYLESLMLSAEEKFMSCVLLTRVWAGSSDAVSASGDTVRSVRAILCSALTNAAVCRSARLVKAPTGQAGTVTRAAYSGEGKINGAAALLAVLPAGATLCELSTLDLMGLAISVHDAGTVPRTQASFSAIILDMKMALLMERRGRVSEALENFITLKQRLEELQATSPVAVEPMFVTRYPAGQMLTQSYMSGHLCVPVSYITSESTLESSAVAVGESSALEDGTPSPRTVQTLIADVDVKLAKLRLKLS